MFFAAALLAFAPVLFLALAVRAQKPYIVQNTATGFVFEDHNPVPGQVGNSIVGAPYNESRALLQTWTPVPFPDGTVTFSNARLVGSQRIYTHVDGLPGKVIAAQNYGSQFTRQTPFGFGPSPFAFVFAFESPQLAITAPKVAHGPLTLQPYNATNLYQHWLYWNAPAAGSTTSLVGPSVENLEAETKKVSHKL